MITTTFIFGTEAVRHFDETGEVPGETDFDDFGCLIVPKEFPSKEIFDAYIAALEDSDGLSGYRVVNTEETVDTDLDSRIKRLLKDGPMVSLYFETAMLHYGRYISGLSDDGIREIFGCLFSQAQVRAAVGNICNRLDETPDSQS